MKLTITKSEGAIFRSLLQTESQTFIILEVTANRQSVEVSGTNNKYVIKHWSKLIYIYNNVLSLRR